MTIYDKIYFDNICDTPFWDIDQIWLTNSPKLSPCFTDTVCVWFTTGFLTIVAPYIIWTSVGVCRRSRPTIPYNYYNISRLAIACLLTIVTIVDLGLSLYRRYHHKHDDSTDSQTTIAYLIRTGLLIVSRLSITTILYYHRLYGIHNSGFVWFYQLLDTISGALSITAYVLAEHRLDFNKNLIIICLEFSFTALLLILCSIADRLIPVVTNTADSNDTIYNNCPKDRVSFISRLTYLWVDSLLWKGFRKPLKLTDLWPMRSSNMASNLIKNFEKYYKISQPFDRQSNDDNPIVGLVVNDKEAVLNNNNESWFLKSSVNRVYSNKRQHRVVSLSLILNFMDNSEPQWHGYVYCFMLLAINLAMGFVVSYNQQKMQTLGQRIKSLLTSLVYRKSLVLSNDSKREANTGQIVNLMNIDCQRFLGIQLYLLYIEMGLAMISAIVLLLIAVVFNAYVIKLIDSITTDQIKLKDNRQTVINDILNGIKVLKLYAWEEAFIEKIEKLRSKELENLRKAGYWSSLLIFTANSLTFFTSLTTFGIFIAINSSATMSAQKLFVSIVLLRNIQSALQNIPSNISRLILVIISVKRLNKFFNLPEITNYLTNYTDNDHVVCIDNASFAWSSNEDAILNDINLKITDGMFVAIIGKVGSAKSSLLSALLGEMDILSGRVNIRHGVSIAYVPQQPWIINKTLKDNILFGKDNDPVFYKQVFNSCALSDDLKQLSAGDETEIGEKGINLSGGQKQRVSLARAVYSEADLYLLDDPLSAVDSHVGQHIMREVLHSETGLLRNKTRIMVTNQLFVLPFVDRIVVLKNGKIESIGTYNELLESDEDFREVCRQSAVVDNNNNNSDDNNETTAKGLIRKRKINVQTTDDLMITVDNIIFNMIGIGFDSAAKFWLSDWSSDTDTNKNTYYFAIYAVIGLANVVFIGITFLSIIFGVVLAAKRWHRRLMSSILHSPMSFFDTTPLGRIFNRFSKDIDKYYIRTSRQLKRLESVSRSLIYNHFSETLAGISSIRAYGLQERAIRELDARIDTNQLCLYPSAMSLSWVILRLEMITSLFIFFAALFAVHEKGKLNGGSVGLLLTYATAITDSVYMFINLTSIMENNMISVERVDEYSALKPEADWHSSSSSADQSSVVSTVAGNKWPETGCIEFVDYSTRYREGLDLVLKQITIKINAKEKIGIVGRTGSGKSSLSLGLFRIIESVGGKIVIDGIDISQLGLHDLRSGLTIIPQEPVLFAGTVRSNLDPFDRHSDSELWTALERSHLKHYILSNESGLDFPVNEGGDNLSVGQRQLICLARALLRHTTVLILDEATAAVDVETDTLIQTTIRSEFANCTVLTIAHRLNTILDSDRVLVLSDGRVVEFESPTVLLSNISSQFYLLSKNAGIV
ncbi:multidrug resistance-associated protein 1-like [Oppia nitens]|uniref:multidrug resistance-associated protein 1-like n=1 Tax=Oppia nitens TaxID=1686743 RepID=UPI0023DC6F25|nr:multidrug resistance-associated protein 1-like [Oppia nitens]